MIGDRRIRAATMMIISCAGQRHKQLRGRRAGGARLAGAAGKSQGRAYARWAGMMMFIVYSFVRRFGFAHTCNKLGDRVQHNEYKMPVDWPQRPRDTEKS